MTRHATATREEWRATRRELLEEEKELTRRGDELARRRRELPWVPVDKAYRFESESGGMSLADLFGGRSQLLVYHFMFDPEWDEGCSSCSFVIDNLSGALVHLGAYDTSFAVVSRAPIAKIARFRKRKGRDFAWVSSFGSDFNHDFGVTLGENEAEYNYTPVSALPAHMQGMSEAPGLSVFVRDGGRLFHTYSTYARGLDRFLNTYNLLDSTPLGRREEAHAPVGARYSRACR